MSQEAYIEQVRQQLEKSINNSDAAGALGCAV